MEAHVENGTFFLKIVLSGEVNEWIGDKDVCVIITDPVCLVDVSAGQAIQIVCCSSGW